MILYDSLPIPVPVTVAICPECNGQLEVEWDEWYPDTMMMGDCPDVMCIREEQDRERLIEQHAPNWMFKDYEHRHWQGEWRRSNIIDRWGRVLAWFDKYLKPGD